MQSQDLENNQLNDRLIRRSIQQSQQSQESIIRHQQGEQLTTGQKIKQAIDIFAFLPVPKTYPISTKRSICGSFLLLFIFLSYIAYSLVEFFVMNYPRMNQYSEPLAEEIVEVPNFAYGFVFGESLNTTLYDPRLFTYKAQNVVKIAGVPDDKPVFNFGPEYCGDLDWIGAPYNNKKDFQFWCPDPKIKKDLVMQGLLLASKVQRFPRITTTYCNTVTSLLFCKNTKDLQKTTSGGRIYLFTEQGVSTNWATGKQTQGKRNFELQYYFLVPGDYNRAEIIMELTENQQMPDYLTSFTPTLTNTTEINSQNFYVSNVSVYDPFSAFQIWFRLSDSVTHIDIVYDTILDKVSQWGALWGVLFAGFAFYFLRYNTEKFYSKNEDWAEFDKGLQKVDQAVDRTISTSQNQQSQQEQQQQYQQYNQ